MYRILETKEYINWFNALKLKEQGQVHARIARLKIDGYFGIVKKLDKTLSEFKWKNGRRVYFTLVREGSSWTIILLLGGYKDSQDRDINKAKSIICNLQEKI